MQFRGCGLLLSKCCPHLECKIRPNHNNTKPTCYDSANFLREENVPRTVSLSILPGCALGVALFSLTVLAQQSQTVRQGVFTEAQAGRGQAIYKTQCSSCHGEMLEGRLGPPLAGANFIAAWDKQPLSELAAKIRNPMPQNNPGKLSGQQTADILAYILHVGKFHARRAELDADEAALKQTSWPSCNCAPPKLRLN